MDPAGIVHCLLSPHGRSEASCVGQNLLWMKRWWLRSLWRSLSRVLSVCRHRRQTWTCGLKKPSHQTVRCQKPYDSSSFYLSADLSNITRHWLSARCLTKGERPVCIKLIEIQQQLKYHFVPTKVWQRATQHVIFWGRWTSSRRPHRVPQLSPENRKLRLQ